MLADVDAFAATAGPGLASSLMIGAATAKGLALGAGKPYLGVNHLEGHLLSPFFGPARGIVRPAVGLVVSGGHTLLVDIGGFRQYRRLGGTLDDAAGEAFDKVAKLLGLPYPGGPQIDRLATRGRPGALRFAAFHAGQRGFFAFSFSGLKTAVRYLLPKIGPGTGRGGGGQRRQLLADVCASFQAGRRGRAGAQDHPRRPRVSAGRERVAVSGGVSMNSRLREGSPAPAGAKVIELACVPARALHRQRRDDRRRRRPGAGSRDATHAGRRGYQPQSGALISANKISF